ncbi:kinesin-like protein KIF19 [Elysia marginata]|uniref:Kinesin-like protein KIF19 n=1 Tax=Elysia marginata TaxID=1093978 RepID=A0AAV4EW33_9GAST|nr:kinesin-like protein KIF19 [Elysia marginata]
MSDKNLSGLKTSCPTSVDVSDKRTERQILLPYVYQGCAADPDGRSKRWGEAGVTKPGHRPVDGLEIREGDIQAVRHPPAGTSTRMAVELKSQSQARSMGGEQNLIVALRIRPMAEDEIISGAHPAAYKVEDNRDVYEATTKVLIPNVTFGYNATVFAYGPTAPNGKLALLRPGKSKDGEESSSNLPQYAVCLE